MFLHRLSALSICFGPRVHPSCCLLPHLTCWPPPRWCVQEPAPHRQPWIMHSSGRRSFHSDREPPSKRRKGGNEAFRHGRSKWKPNHRGFRTDGGPRGGERGGDGWRNGPVQERGKDVDRTKGGPSKWPPHPTASQIPDSRPPGGEESSSGPPPESPGPSGPPDQQQGGGGPEREPPPPGIPPPARSLRRRWTWCSTQPEPPGVDGGFEFSVMTYNILSQELLRDNAYLYRHCHPAHLPWEYRLPNLLTEIQQHAADILCLQEVQQDHYEAQIKPALQALGYQCEFKKRTGKKPDGCAVSFKTSRFSLLSSKPVEFFRGGDALLDRDNVGLILLLQPTGTGDPPGDPSSCVCVANTHLLYNPHRGDVKLAQLAILLAEIGRVSRLPDGSSRPVLLCGDLNSSPQSPLYSFLTRGRLEYKGLRIGMVSGQEILQSGGSRGQRRLQSPIWSPKLGISRRCRYESKRPKFTPAGPPPAVSDQTVQEPDPGEPDGPSRWKEFRWSIEHGLSLRSAYGHRLEPEGRPEITTCHSRTAQTVDYILYSPDSGASLPGGRGLQLLGRLSLVSQLELEEVNSLPNQHHSSDHLPLLVRFRLRP